MRGRGGTCQPARRSRKLARVIGSILNALCIVLAGLAVWMRVPAVPAGAQRRLLVFLGLVTMLLGFQVLWRSLHGSFGHMLYHLATVLLAVMLGRVMGQRLGIQTLFSRWGQFARTRLMEAGEGNRPGFGDTFSACTVIFCLTPLAVVGPLQEGLRGDWRGLAVKSVVDGLATLSLVRTQGLGVMLGALPVLALQGTLGLLVLAWQQQFGTPGVADAVYATSGFLLVAVALVMLQVLRIALADYLLALVWAALFGWWWL